MKIYGMNKAMKTTTQPTLVHILSIHNKVRKTNMMSDWCKFAGNAYHNQNDGRKNVDAEAEANVDRTESKPPIFAIFIF